MPPTANPVVSDPEAKKRAARETIDILHEISTLLVRGLLTTQPTESIEPILIMFQNTDRDRQSLSYCVSLIENGVNPEALAVRPPFLHVAHATCRPLTDVQKVIRELRARQESQEARLGA
jgi:mitotic-spindle organizing protein 1